MNTFWHLRVTCEPDVLTPERGLETIAWITAWTEVDEPPHFETVIGALRDLGIEKRLVSDTLSFNSTVAVLDRAGRELVCQVPHWDRPNLKLWVVSREDSAELQANER